MPGPLHRGASDLLPDAESFCCEASKGAFGRRSAENRGRNCATGDEAPVQLILGVDAEEWV